MEIAGINYKTISDESFEDLVKNLIMIKKIPRGFQIIHWKETVYNILENLKKKNIYITVKKALELSKVLNISMKKYNDIHLLCPFILDWWNIWKDNFCAPALCYYADFGDYYKCEISKIPMRLPYNAVNKPWENDR